MQVRVSITADGRPPVDVAVDCHPEATLGELRPALAEYLGQDADFPLAGNGRPLPDAALIGGAGLRTGCTLTIGPAGDRTELATSVLALRVVSGPDAGQIMPLRRGNHLIGREAGGVRLDDPDVSRRHAELRVDLHGVAVRDLGSTNGTRLDRAAVGPDWQEVPLDGRLQVGDCILTIAGTGEPPAVTRPDGSGGLLVHRPPRVRAVNPDRRVTFPNEAQLGPRPRVHWLAALLPAALGIALAIGLGSVQFLAFALLSPVTVVAGAVSERRDWRRGSRLRRCDFVAAEREAQARLDSMIAEEAAARHRRYPDAAAVRHTAMTPDCRLWERRRGDDSFLAVRVGTADQPAGITTNRDDDAVVGLLEGVPAVVSIRTGALGIAGPLPLARATARWLIAQCLVLHCPADVSLALLTDEADHAAEHWNWLRWPADSLLSVATTERERHQLVEDLVRLVRERQSLASAATTGWLGQWTVLLIDPAAIAAAIPGVPFLLEHGPACGLTAICVGPDPRVLPPACAATVVPASDTGARLRISTPGVPALDAVADRVSTVWCDELARSLAPLRDADLDASASLPDALSLAELHGQCTATSLQRRWTHEPRPLARVGAGVNGAFEIDLVRDGPHLLIAGTTGSGKSELLRTLVTSLALTSPPDQLSFVLIDYKGGAAFADCAGLPHVLGVVTDLDGHLTRRAMVSLDAELHRREAAFARARVADIDSYRKAAHATDEPIPRLVLVIDEFASLAEELPDFLAGLLAIAQRGRSLGVHLVLATQRPAGVLSLDIKANMSLRIALRVTDPAESVDVIGVELATRIPSSAPGRAIARLADGDVVEFQTAQAGRAPAQTGRTTVTALDSWHRRHLTPGVNVPESQLPVLCNAISSAAEAMRIAIPAPPWLEPLPLQVLTAELGEDGPAPWQLPIGLTDDPAGQRRQVEILDLELGQSVGFIGGPRSGRTSALRTAVGQAMGRMSSDRLHIYLIDQASHGFDQLKRHPHCGGLVERDDPASAARLITRLLAELSDRRRRLAELGVTSLGEAWRNGHPLAAILLIIDGWEAFCAGSEEFDAGRTVDGVLELLREGSTVGLTVLIAGDRSLLASRIGSALSRRLVLRLTDRADLSMAGISAGELPEPVPAGRLICAENGLITQLALLAPDPAASAQWAAISRTALMTSSGEGPRITIRPIPHHVDFAQLIGTEAATDECLLGAGGDDGATVSCDLFSPHSRFLVVGPARSGRSNTAMVIARQSLASGHRLLIAANRRSPLAGWAGQNGLELLDPAARSAGAEHREGTRYAGYDAIIVDDAEQFTDTAAGDLLLELVCDHPAAVVVTVRTDELAVSFRGIGVEMRRHRTGLLLQPGPGDGELLGIRLGPQRSHRIVGRGVLVTDRTTAISPCGIAVQVAR